MIRAVLSPSTAAQGPNTTAINVPPTACAVVPPGTGILNIIIVKEKAAKIESNGMVRLLSTERTRLTARVQVGTVTMPVPSEKIGLRYPSGMCMTRDSDLYGKSVCITKRQEAPFCNYFLIAKNSQ